MGETQIKYTQTFEQEMDDVRLTPYTAIPNRVRQHFLGNLNQVVSLASAHSMMISQLQATGRRPIHYKELSESLLSDLRSSGFVVHELDGTVRKADCMLYVQSVEEREHWRNQRLTEQIMQANADEIAENLDEFRRAHGKSLFRPAENRDLRAGRVPDRPPAGAHVYTDREQAPGQFD